MSSCFVVTATHGLDQFRKLRTEFRKGMEGALHNGTQGPAFGTHRNNHRTAFVRGQGPAWASDTRGNDEGYICLR